jgi:hypothetical protein
MLLMTVLRNLRVAAEVAEIVQKLSYYIFFELRYTVLCEGIYHHPYPFPAR